MSANGPMLSRAAFPLPERPEQLGELHPFLEQLGSVDGLITLTAASAAWRGPAIRNLQGLALFLENYRERLMFPLEWPAISRAHFHSSRNEARELITLDQSMARQPDWSVFAAASRRVGRCQLQKLRPLRDVRVAQRYLCAAEEGRAQGWHTLVFGLTLAIYSLPVRQGLIQYASQTLRGFIRCAANPLRLSRQECSDLLEAFSHDLPNQLEHLFGTR